MRRLSVSLRSQPAMHINRVSLHSEKLVYVIVQNKRHHYRHGRSSIVYIGTTKTGVSRMAQSAAALTDRVLGQHGIKDFDVRIVTCRPRQRVKTWRKLERALLLVFREMYGEVPRFNVQGKGIRETDEFSYFARERLRKVLHVMG